MCQQTRPGEVPFEEPAGEPPPESNPFREPRPHGSTGRADVAREEWQRFHASEAFRRAIASIIEPGMTIVVTPDSLTGRQPTGETHRTGGQRLTFLKTSDVQSCCRNPTAHGGRQSLAVR